MSSPNTPDFPDNSSPETFLSPGSFNDFDALDSVSCKSRSSSLNACFTRSRPSSITCGSDCRSICSAQSNDFDVYRTDGATTLTSDTVALASARIGVGSHACITHTRSLACLHTLGHIPDSSSSSEETTNDSNATMPPRSQMTIADIRKSVSNFFQWPRKNAPKLDPIIDEQPPTVHRAFSSRVTKNARSPRVDQARMRRSASFAGFAALSKFRRQYSVEPESDDEEGEVASDAQVNPESL